MSTTEIILIAVAILVFGFSMYRRFMKKQSGKESGQAGHYSGTSLSSTAKDEDYEPYSKNKEE